jgi:transcriptional regulator with XRE-family HTH domain
MADVHKLWVDRIRTERKVRGWDKPEMARRLAHAAGKARGGLPSHESLLSYVKRWERGGVEKISERYRLLYARAFGISEEELFGKDEGDVNRRDFVGSSLVASFTLTVSTDDGSSTGRRIGASTIARLRHRTARLRRLDDVLGGVDTYRVYRDELSATTALATKGGYTDATGRALMAVVAEQAQQAGWAAFDAGWQPTARKHFRESLTAASDAGDTSLIANAMAYLAYQKISTGQPGTGEADASCRIADSSETPPTVRALLNERAAWAHAVAGNTAATEQALDRAREALTGGCTHLPGPDWAGWVDRTELDIMSGRCWSMLRDHGRAIPVLERALDRYDDTHARDKALYSTWLIDAHLDAGEVERAATVTFRALDLCADVASVRPLARIERVLRRLRSHARVPAVGHVIDRAEDVFRRSPGSPSPDTRPSRREV